jgi:acyl carrier protein
VAWAPGDDRHDDDRARDPELSDRASGRTMQQKEVFDELKTILVARLKFDPRRAAEVTEGTALPKGIEDSIGLDSLDFIELSLAIEERFGVVLDESEDLTAHFASFDTLSRFIAGRLGGA